MKTPSWDAAVLDAKRLVTRAQRCRIYRFADGFDEYNTPSEMYQVIQGTPVISSSYARFTPPAGLPGQGIYFPGNAYVARSLNANVTTFVIKLSALFVTLPGATNGGPFVGVTDGTGGYSSVQWCLTVFSSGVIGLIRAINPGTLLAQSNPGVIAAGGYYGIEMQIAVATSGVTATVWVNGSQVLNATGLDTQQTSNTYGNTVWLGDLNNRFTGIYMDDFRVWDTTGSTQNAALGTDSRIITKLPSGVGTNTNWTPNGAAANWQCVDDNPPDDDTSYVSAAGSSIVDDYAMPSAGLTAAPVTVVARSRVRKDDGATRTMQIGVLSSGSAEAGSTYTLSSTYAFIDGDCSPEDPHTSAPWTAAAADAAHHWKQEVT